MKNILFKGCGTAIVTPFTGNLVNYEEFGKLIEFQINECVDAIIVCGTTGESATMSDAERKETIKYAIKKVDKRVPVIAGTGSNSTHTAIELSKYAESVGADGLLIVTPYYNKTTQRGLIAHYKAIASEVSIPIVLYNVPSRTGVNINPETCLELSKVPNIVAVKEASGNISQIAKIAHLCRNNLAIYSGNDDQIVPVLSLGGLGVISVLSNIEPKFVHKMITDYLEGNVKESFEAQLNALPLIEALFSEVNPIPVKAALNMMGYNCGIPRMPLVELSDQGKEKLEKAMKDFGTI